jgi:predicted CopG family antitoxin
MLLKEEISLSHSIERLAERVKKFADTEILGDADTITARPEVLKRVEELKR